MTTLLDGLEPNHMEGNGQVISCAQTLQPQPFMRRYDDDEDDKDDD